MKILIIVNVDWFIYSHRLPIILEAKKKGYEIHIATKITDLAKKELLINQGIKFHELSFDRSGKKISRIIYIFFKILNLINKLKPNILHLVTIQPILIGGIAARIMGIKKIVYAISGLGHTFLSENLITKIRRLLILKSYQLALGGKNRKVIFQNPKDHALLSKVCSLSNKETIIIPGSGVDLKKFNYSKIPESNPIVMMASRLLVSKGVYEFIEAAKIVQKKGLKIKFQLVGKPDKSNPLTIKKYEIEKWESEGYIEYLGYRNDLNKIIPKAHIIVLPSYYPEGLPKILCEAAACGRPVITTDEPGCKDAIKNGETGILIRRKDSKNLANAIIKIIKNKKLLNDMSIAARARAEKLFDIKSVVKTHIDIYKSLN